MSAKSSIYKIAFRKPGKRRVTIRRVKRVEGVPPTEFDAGNLIGYETADGYVSDGLVIKRFWTGEAFFACTECGDFNNDGEGWNYLCGNCADRADIVD